jgi:glycerate kinase
MKIIIAPDSFKGSLSAIDAAAAICRGIARYSKKIETVCLPLADGGEGTVAALVAATGGKIRRKRVTGPLGAPVDAFFGLIDKGKTGVVEMAASSGLPLVPPGRRNPLLTTTFGAGELIRQAVLDGCKHIIIGAGGSATVDGGLGLLQALGAVFRDARGKPVGRGGRELVKIHSVETEALAAAIWGIKFTVAADVTNPLCGPEGAARVFGPQKGATPEAVRLLDRGLRHFAGVIKRSVAKDVITISGGGAAGGLAAGAAAFLDAVIRPGIDIVLEKNKFEKKLVDCDLVITGEGRTDGQTLFGKAPLGVARLARRSGVPVVCLSGGLAPEARRLYQAGFTALFSLADGPLTLAEAERDAAVLLERAAENIVRLFVRGK